MKAVMISIQPKWCELIASGKKTIEVRKTRPKIDTPFKCYIYCTKAKSKEERLILQPFGYELGGLESNLTYRGDGKVIGEFVCDRISEYFYYKLYEELFDESIGCFVDLFVYDLPYGELEQTCLSYEEIEKYGNTNTLYGWHISDLVIYDKPRKIGEFYGYKKCNSCMSGYESSACIFDEDCKVPYTITRPPQSWQYVEEKENYDE